MFVYILLYPNANVAQLEKKFTPFMEKYMGDDMKQSAYQVAFHLQPLKDIHVRSEYDYEMAGNGNLSYLKYLGIAALFILFIAWINYVNLSTAHSLDRSKEVGIRKVVGAGKFQLIRQFLVESLCLNSIAIIIGVVIIIPYVFFGGYRTLAWIDLFQGCFLLAVIIFVPLFDFPDTIIEYFQIFFSRAIKIFQFF